MYILSLSLQCLHEIYISFHQELNSKSAYCNGKKARPQKFMGRANLRAEEQVF